MAELEKVIRGLEMHKSGLCNVLTANGKVYCPYWENDDNCMVALLNDALSLLKAQEPRVMDADEIVLSAEPSGWLWLEMENGHCGEAYKTGRTISGFINFGNGFDSLFTSLFPEDYGKTWRCWTSRPTDEQREKVKWE